MKLKNIEHCQGYRFALIFANGVVKEVDLQELIGQHVPLEALDTARIDPEWGCLEFKEGSVDIDPKTLYRYATAHDCRQAA